MAIDQLTVDCLSLAATFPVTMSASDEHRWDLERHRPRSRRREDRDDRPPGRTAAEAATLHLVAAAHLQRLVDTLASTRPEPERVYELQVLHHTSPTAHQILLCSDARVVFAEGVEGDLPTFVVFGHGVLDVASELWRSGAVLRMGPTPTLVWPRLAGHEAVLDLGVRHVMSEPSPTLRALHERIGRGERGGIPLRPAAVGPAPATSPPAWHPDPTGRHEHRWWDGTRWTADAADAGVRVIDPL